MDINILNLTTVSIDLAYVDTENEKRKLAWCINVKDSQQGQCRYWAVKALIQVRCLGPQWLHASWYGFHNFSAPKELEIVRMPCDVNFKSEIIISLWKQKNVDPVGSFRIGNLNPTWIEHATFWSGVRRATIAPRIPRWEACSCFYREYILDGLWALFSPSSHEVEIQLGLITCLGSIGLEVQKHVIQKLLLIRPDGWFNRDLLCENFIVYFLDLEWKMHFREPNV